MNCSLRIFAGKTFWVKFLSKTYNIANIRGNFYENRKCCMLPKSLQKKKNPRKLKIFFNILFHKNVNSFCENFRLSEICLIPYASAYVLRNLTQYKLSYIRTTGLFNVNNYYLVKILNNCQLLLKLKLPCLFWFLRYSVCAYASTYLVHMYMWLYVNFHCFLSLLLSLLFLLLLSLW